MAEEWVEWHRAYARDSHQARRLGAVRSEIRRAMDLAPPGTLRILSMCCGDGRDLLGALIDHPRRGDVRARLVDVSEELTLDGRAEVGRLGLNGVEFVTDDAALTDTYASIVPVQIALVCGVFGNISDADVRHTIRSLPTLCASGARVVWTRGRFPPDLTPSIREWFHLAGFEEEAFIPIPESTATVGTHRLVAAPSAYRPANRMFTFLPPNERPSHRGRPPSGAPAPTGP